MGQSHPSIEAPRPRTPAGGGSSATAQTALPDPSVVAAEPTTDSPAAREIVDVTPEYLAEFFHDRTSIQADKLAAAYLGKWMKVSGPLGNVGGFTTFSQVTFAFNTFGSLSVYLLFRDGDVVENRVSTLSQGDQITVLGQIDRIDAVSLQLGNCELIDAVATAPTRQVVFDDAPPELADTSPASLMELFAGRTEAQAATLLKQHRGKAVRVSGEVEDVSVASAYGGNVRLRGRCGISFLLFFDADDKDAERQLLIALNTGDKITVSGLIHEIQASVVSLDNSKLIHVRKRSS